MNRDFKISNPPNDLDVIEVAGKLSVKLGNTTRWEEFGMKLLEINDSENVKSIDPENKQSLTEKCKGLLNSWKDSTEDPRWEKVIVVLKDMRLRDLATKLEKALGTTDTKGKATEIDRKRKATPQGEDEPDSKRLKCIPSIDEKTIKERYRKLKFEANVINKSTDMEEPKKQQHHVLIETVNLFEYYAAVLQLKKGCKAERYSSKGSSYLVGKWGEAEIPVVIIRTHQGKDGRRGSFNATKKAIEWLPYLKYIFAVGVCGGRKGKVNLGDVVVSRVIQDYATELKAKGGKLIDRCPHWDIANKTDFHEFLDQEADAIPGVILSGNLLMADACKQHDLVETYPDGIAFEMEGTGIARACEEMDKEKIVFMVVKGVCDLADENKDDNWQPEAALNAAKALCKAMKSYEPIASLSPVNLAEKEHKTKTRMRNQNVRKQDRSQRQVRKPRQYANHKGNLRNKGRGKGRNQRQGRGRK